MIINISDIAKIHGASMNVSFEGPMPELDGHEDGYIFDRSVVFEGKLTNNSGVLRLKGLLKASYTANCSRCLMPVNGLVEATVEEEFVEGEKTDIEDAYTFQGNALDLSKPLLDNLILNIPVKVICSIDCKGFCSICGKNLNEEQCDCEEQVMNPKLEVLKNLKF